MPIQRPLDSSPLERWVQLALAERYSSTLREPVPDALLKLLNGARHD